MLGKVFRGMVALVGVWFTLWGLWEYVIKPSLGRSKSPWEW